MKNLKILLASLFLIGFIALGVTNIINKHYTLEFQTILLKSKSTQLKELNLQYDILNKEIDSANKGQDVTQEQLDKLNLKKQELDKQKKALEAELQAKAEEKKRQDEALALASTRVINAVTNTQSVSAVGSSHYDLVIAAGISPSDFGYVDYIVMHEGHYDPCVINGGAVDCSYAINGGGKAYGVCQALPGNKMASAGADWATNPVTQLRWCNSYAIGRYGSWANAYSFWINNKWW